MDERISERIDRYLRKEMSADESVRFEQDTLDNRDLRKEIELTCIIKRGIINRHQKLRRIRYWERKRRNRFTLFTVATSAVAILIVGFFVLHPRQQLPFENTGTSTEKTHAKNTFEKNEQNIQYVKESIEERNDYEIIAVVDSLEQNRIISSINDISGNKLLTNSTMPQKDIQTLDNDSYELHWYKICSLIKIGRTEEAKVCLLNFITINGKYKNTADSLLQTLK